MLHPSMIESTFLISYNRYIYYPIYNVIPLRAIGNSIAVKVLDAPNIVNDFYLSLIDWSSTNLLAVSLAHSVYLWNGDTNDVSELFSNDDPSNLITSVKWHRDGEWLAVGCKDGSVAIWDVPSQSQVRTYHSHCSRVGVMAWSEECLTTGSRDGYVFHFDTSFENDVGRIIGDCVGGEVCGLTWSPDGSKLAIGANNNTCTVWEKRNIRVPKYVTV